MLYTATKPSPRPVFSGKATVNTGITYRQHLLQRSYYGLRLRQGLLFLLFLSISACGPKPLPLTSTSNNSQEANLAQPLGQQPARPLRMTASNQTTAIAPLLFARGQEALQAGQYETAVALLKEATELDATDATYHLWLGRAYGHQAEHAGSGEQFFLARQVRKNLEKAVALNPDLIEARLDLLSYYLQAPLLLGGGIEKAKAQAAEITKRDPHQGALAQQQCQQAAEEEPALFAVSRED